MNSRALKMVCIAASAVMFIWWFAAAGLTWSVEGGGYMELFSLVLFLASLALVAIVAYGRKYFGVVGFTAIAVLFNPLVPFTLSRITFLVLDAVCIAAFLVSLAQSRTQQRSAAALDKLHNL
jgi:hypothetical protein